MTISILEVLRAIKSAIRLDIRSEEMAVMSLDERGRLVANKAAIFNNQMIIDEIEAAKILGIALAAIRSAQQSSGNAPTDRQG